MTYCRLRSVQKSIRQTLCFLEYQRKDSNPLAKQQTLDQGHDRPNRVGQHDTILAAPR